MTGEICVYCGEEILPWKMEVHYKWHIEKLLSDGKLT